MEAGWTTRCCSALALIAVCALAADAQGRGAAPAEPLGIFPPRLLWTLPLNLQLSAPPALSESKAYFALDENRLVAYDLTTGTQQWIAEASAKMRPVIGEGLLFLVDGSGLTARRLSDGGIEWQIPISEPLAAPPVWDNGWLVVATGREVLAFRARDGHLLWRRDPGARASAPPALAADRVYVPAANNRVVALQVETGEILWERRLGGVPGDVLALDDRLFVGSSDNFFYCLNAATGRVEWRWRTGGDIIGLPSIDERNVYFVSLDNVLRALSRSNGVQRWFRLLPFRPTTGPLKIGSSVLVTGVTPPVRAFNTRTGMPAGEIAPTGELAAPPLLVPGSLGRVPQTLLVTRDLAKGATAWLVGRSLEPAVAAFSALPTPQLETW